MTHLDSSIKRSIQSNMVRGAGARLKTLWNYLRLLILAVVLAILIKEMLVEAYNIPSESMERTLLVGDFLIADKITYGAHIPLTGWRLPSLKEPALGDVVVFRFPDNPHKNFIKRIIAKGGDEVKIVNKVVHVNGLPLSEGRYAIHSDSTIIPPGTTHPRDNFGPITIPAGHYFVLGDNRDNSSDSRFWGTVPRDNIIGKALFVHWSWRPSESAPKITWWNPLSIGWASLYYIYNVPSHVRWDRLFSVIK